VPAYAAPEWRTHALSVFYTITIGAAAVAPPFAGFIGDFIGIPATVMIVCALTLAIIPFAFLLQESAPGRAAYLNQVGWPGRARAAGRESGGFSCRDIGPI
jgi:predicted MFS family arabinose efflux permease